MSEGLLTGKVIVVTGASAGIGADAARVFAREGARLILTARRESELSALVDELQATGAEAGFVKLIAAPKRVAGHHGGGRLVGATVVAPTGGDLVHEAALAMQTNMFVGRLAQTTHAYPTWAMAMQQAALQFFAPSSGLTARSVRAQRDAAR